MPRACAQRRRDPPGAYQTGWPGCFQVRSSNTPCLELDCVKTKKRSQPDAAPFLDSLYCHQSRLSSIDMLSKSAVVHDASMLSAPRARVAPPALTLPGRYLHSTLLSNAKLDHSQTFHRRCVSRYDSQTDTFPRRCVGDRCRLWYEDLQAPLI